MICLVNWLRDHLGEGRPGQTAGDIPASNPRTFPQVIPAGPWILDGLKRVLAGAPKRERSLRPEETCRFSLARVIHQVPITVKARHENCPRCFHISLPMP